MKAKQYAIGLGLAATAFLTGCATTLDNTARVGLNVMTTPYKVLESSVTEYSPIQGVKDSILDIGEQGYNTVTNKPTDRHPADRGELSTEIAERPLLNTATNIAVAGGLGFGIADWAGAHAPHIWQTAGYAAGGQALVEGANTVLD